MSAVVRRAPDEPRYHLGLALGAWLIAFVLAAVGGSVLLSATGYAGTDSADYPIWLIAVLQVPLWIGLAGGALAVSRWWGTSDLVRDYGFSFAPVDVLGLPIGVVTQLVFVPVLYRVMSWFGVDTSSLSDPAEQLTSKATGLGVALLVLLVVVGAPVVEELFFRGLVLRSIQARWSDGLALVGSAVLFGLAHFQVLQFPALVLAGLVFGYCAQRTGRLGMAVFAHAGFNATTVVLLLR